MSYTTKVPAAVRTLQLLERLAEAPEGRTAAELEVALQLSRSSLFALLNTLKERDYVEQSRRRGRYRLGPSLWRLLPGRQRGLSALVEAFHLDGELHQQPETVALARLDGTEVVVVAQRESRQPVRAGFRHGQRQPARQSAAGLVLLAGLPAEAIEHAFPGEAEPLRPQLAAARRTGWTEQPQAETVEIACPICPDGIQPVAALVAAVPGYRFAAGTTAAVLKPLQQAAARLSARLGAPGYQPYGWTVWEPLGPATALDAGEVRQFLHGPWSARLACVRQDGSPHVLPLWYEWDGHYLWVVASPNARWKEYVRHNPRVSLTIDEPWPPLRRAFIVGDVREVPPGRIDGGLVGLRRRLATRYLGQGAERQVELAQPEGWVAFRIVPDKLTGRQGLGEEFSDLAESNEAGRRPNGQQD